MICRPIAKKQLCKQAAGQQPLLGNSSVVSAATREHAIIEENICVRSVSGLYNEDWYFLSGYL
jgi:hypothetical protein